MYNHNTQMIYPAMPMALMGGNNDGFGNDGWWAWILFAMLFGWGNNGNWGWGNNGGGGATATIDASLQRGFDTQAILGKLDRLGDGLCSLGYDQLAQINGVNSNIFQTGAGLQQSITQAQIADMQSFNALSRQISDCCCKNENQIAQLKFDMATSDCSIKTLMNQLVQQLMWGQQNGIRDLSDLIRNEFCALRNEQKDALIADLRSQLNNCGRDNALQNLFRQLVDTLQPTPTPAYPACNPRGVGNWAAAVLSGNGCGFNNNNCCGNNNNIN